jgi:AcrR family transcriptional regulator
MRRRSAKLPQSKNAEVTRRKLVGAAIEILRRQGPDAVTTARVARSAGLKQSAFSVHFAGRDEVLEAAANEIVRLMTERLESHLEGCDSSDLAGSLRNTYEAEISGFLAERELTRLFLRHRVDDGTPLGRVFSRHLASARELLAWRLSKVSGVAGDECVRLYVEMRQASMFGVIEALVENRLRDRDTSVRDLSAAATAEWQWLCEQAAAAARAR